MENSIITKTDNQFGTVRCIEENGTVLFCASDVAKALGYARPNDAVQAHCLATVKRRSTISGRRKQEINFIPECDVYRLICHSKLPDAIRFEKWVFEDVVPNAVHGKQNSEPEQLTLETAEYHYYPKTWHGSPVITAADFAHFTGMSKEAVYPYFHKHPNFDIFHYRHLKNAELRDFKAENPSIPRCIADLYIITRKGCECMLRYFGLTADIPILEQNQEELLEQKQKQEEPAIQPRKVFTAAEYIAALEILNDLRLKFKEELESKNCMFPSTTKQNLEAVCRAMGHVSIPLITIGQNDKVI